MRRIGEIGTGAELTQGASAPMRRMTQGVIGGDARAHGAEEVKAAMTRAAVATLQGGPDAVALAATALAMLSKG